jgi:hypothetical protein
VLQRRGPQRTRTDIDTYIELAFLGWEGVSHFLPSAPFALSFYTYLSHIPRTPSPLFEPVRREHRSEPPFALP